MSLAWLNLAFIRSLTFELQYVYLAYLTLGEYVYFFLKVIKVKQQQQKRRYISSSRYQKECRSSAALRKTRTNSEKTLLANFQKR